MTLTSRAMEWLDQNRHRSYPMERDGWREKVSAASGLDCVILDVLLFDNDARGDEALFLERVSVERQSTLVAMKYGDIPIVFSLSEGDVSGERSYEFVRGLIKREGAREAFVSIAFSSHRHVLESVGEGTWELGCKVLPTRVARISDGAGIDRVSSNGSKGVEGHEAASEASGDVVLEDGYRTSPIVHRGQVLVRVGRHYGYDPCKYDFGPEGTTDCRVPLFFFCGQNAINGGNVILKGGAGISVSQGRSYKVRSGSCAGKTVPCVEIVAGREILDVYRPQEG